MWQSPYAVRVPVAYRFSDDTLWDKNDVLHLYPDVVEWIKSNGISGEFKIVPCQPAEEDCIYCDGKWVGYASDNLFMLKFGDFPEAMEGIPKPKKRNKREKVCLS